MNALSALLSTGMVLFAEKLLFGWDLGTAGFFIVFISVWIVSEIREHLFKKGN